MAKIGGFDRRGAGIDFSRFVRGQDAKADTSNKTSSETVSRVQKSESLSGDTKRQERDPDRQASRDQAELTRQIADKTSREDRMAALQEMQGALGAQTVEADKNLVEAAQESVPAGGLTVTELLNANRAENAALEQQEAETAETQEQVGFDIAGAEGFIQQAFENTNPVAQHEWTGAFAAIEDLKNNPNDPAAKKVAARSLNSLKYKKGGKAVYAENQPAIEAMIAELKA